MSEPIASPSPLGTRDAIVCIPGLVASPGVMLGDVARRLAIALDNSAPASVSFRTAEERLMSDRDGSLKSVPLIRRHEGTECTVADVYEFDYRPFLTGSLVQTAPWRQVLAIALTLVLSVFSLVSSLCRRSQTWAQKVQVLYGVTLFTLMFLYMASLIAALGGTVIEPFLSETSEIVATTTTNEVVEVNTAGPASSVTVPTQSSTAVTHDVVQKQPKRPRWLDWLKTGIVAFAGLGLTVRFNLKEALANVAPILSCATGYLSAGEKRSVIIGELTRFIDHLDEQTNVRYRNVHILAYSFGSVIALDALFPQDSDLPKRLERVDTLVTIGCPADFIRTYWPKYFLGRRGKLSTPSRWLNVYNDSDVLGSNFLDTFGQDTSKDKTAGIRCGEDLRRPNDADNIKFGPSVHSFGEWVRFIGFRVHSKYWDRQSENAVSCFEPIVARLYKGDAVIS
jgi:hypothetical protein